MKPPLVELVEASELKPGDEVQIRNSWGVVWSITDGAGMARYHVECVWSGRQPKPETWIGKLLLGDHSKVLRIRSGDPVCFCGGSPEPIASHLPTCPVLHWITSAWRSLDSLPTVPGLYPVWTSAGLDVAFCRRGPGQAGVMEWGLSRGFNLPPQRWQLQFNGPANGGVS